MFSPRAVWLGGVTSPARRRRICLSNAVLLSLFYQSFTLAKRKIRKDNWCAERWWNIAPPNNVGVPRKCFPKTLDCNVSGRDNVAKFIGQVYDVYVLCRRVWSRHINAKGMIREPFARYVTLRSLCWPN